MNAIPSKKQAEEKIGSAVKPSQIEGNFNALVSLRVKNAGIAEMSTNQLSKIDVVSNTFASSATDVNDPT